MSHNVPTTGDTYWMLVRVAGEANDCGSIIDFMADIPTGVVQEDLIPDETQFLIGQSYRTKHKRLEKKL